MCDLCGFRYTEQIILSLAERDLRSPLLARFSNHVTKHRCLDGICGLTWYQCDRSCCVNTRFQCVYTTRGKLSRHLGQFHKLPPPQSPRSLPERTVLPNRNTTTSVEMHPNLVAHSHPLLLKPIIPHHRFESVSLNEHLYNCQTHGYYSAVSRLVCRAAYQEKKAHHEKVPSAWMMVFLNISRIVLLTKDDVHDLLSSVLCVLDRLFRILAAPLNQYPVLG